MKIIEIQVDANQKIVHPGDIAVKRNELVAWICENFDFEVVFDPASNPGKNPEHPFKTAPPVPPPGHVTGVAAEFHKRHVRPRAAVGTIPNGTRYKYSIILRNAGAPAGSPPLDQLDPDLIVDGDK